MFAENLCILHLSELITNIYSLKLIPSMEINVKIKVNLDDLSIWKINQIWLVNSTQLLAKQAKENAPIDTGTLKKSIWVEPNSITTQTTEARVWSRKVVYALRREFENKKNPHKKYYMKRAYDTAPDIVQKEFEKAVDIVIKSL